MSGDVNSSISQRKLNRLIRETAKSVFESIPQIPIHISELKRLMIKENQDASNSISCLEDTKRLLSVLTIGATGRNPTFFKALGHEDVFGLKASIPEGSSTKEIVEEIPFEEGKDTVSENVLYVQLPKGHPILTSDNDPGESSTEPADLMYDDESDIHLCLGRDESEDDKRNAEEPAATMRLDMSENTNSSLSMTPSSDSSDSGDSISADPFEKLRFNAEDDDPMSDPICLGTVLDMAPEKEVPLRPPVLKRTSQRTSSRKTVEVFTQNSETNYTLDPDPHGDTEIHSEIIRKTRSSADSIEGTGPSLQDPIAIDIGEGSAPTDTSSQEPTSSQLSPHRHNLRPKRIIRPPNNFKSVLPSTLPPTGGETCKGEEKRRTRNTSVTLQEKTKPLNASSATLSTPKANASATQRSSSTSAAKKSQASATTDVDIHYTPSGEDINSTLSTMREVLLSLPNFSHSKIRNIHNRSKYKKLSASAAIQMAHEGSIDIDTPDSILGQVNLRSLVNKSTFAKLPPSYQFKLLHLLPQVDNIFDAKNNVVKLRHSSLTNEFVGKACQEWRDRLLRGDFTPETIQKAKIDIEKDKQRIDTWKVKNFEPVWGSRNCRTTFGDKRAGPSPATPALERADASDAVSSESFDDTTPGKKKKSSPDEGDAPRKKFKREKEEEEESKVAPCDAMPEDFRRAEEARSSPATEVPVEQNVKEEKRLEPPEATDDKDPQRVASAASAGLPAEGTGSPPAPAAPPVLPILPALPEPGDASAPAAPEPEPSPPVSEAPAVSLPVELMDTSPSPAPPSVSPSSVRTPASSCSRTPSPALSNPLSAISSGSFQSLPDVTSQTPVRSEPPFGDPDRAESASPASPASTCSTASNHSQTRKYPMTALVNRNREPVGTVNRERSMEICKLAAEKAGSASVVVHAGPLQTLRIQEQGNKGTQGSALPSPKPRGAAGTDPRPTQFVLADGTVAKTAVLLKTADGKTLVATNAGQLKQHMRPAAFRARSPQPSPTPRPQIQVRVQQVRGRPPPPAAPSPRAQGVTLRVCLPSAPRPPPAEAAPSLPLRVSVNRVVGAPREGVFRVPASAAAPAGNALFLDGTKTFFLPHDAKKPAGSEPGQQILLRKNGTQTLIPMSALPSNIRFVRSPVGQAVTLRMPAAEGTGVAGRPSPPGVLFRQQIFQRPLPPDAPKPPPVIRAILVPKPGAAGQQQLVFASQVSFKPTDPQGIGGAPPSIQFPSEPLPLTSHEVQRHLKSSPAPSPSPKLESTAFPCADPLQVLRGLAPLGNEENGERAPNASPLAMHQNKVFLQVGADGTAGKLVLLRTKTGQLVAVPANQVHPVQTPPPRQADATGPPRASSAPPPPQTRGGTGQVLLPDGRAGNVDVCVLTVPRPPPSASSVSMPPSLRATPSPQMKWAGSGIPTPESATHDAAGALQSEGTSAAVHFVGGGDGPRVSHAPNVSSVKKGSVKTHVPLLPKTPSSLASLDGMHANGGMTCNVKAMVICKQCGAFCHTDCARPQSVCVSCLIR